MDKPEFERELSGLINRFSLEQYSNTPDFILATYMADCLKAYNTAVAARQKWYGEGRIEPTLEIGNG